MHPACLLLRLSKIAQFSRKVLIRKKIVLFVGITFEQGAKIEWERRHIRLRRGNRIASRPGR